MLTPPRRQAVAELERMLADSGVGAQADVDRARDQAQGLGLFIRGLIGLDRDAATDTLSGFIPDRTLTASQLDFLNLIVNYLTEHGTVDAGRLYESPFTGVARKDQSRCSAQPTSTSWSASSTESVPRPIEIDVA